MTESSRQLRAREEVEALHHFFVGWFSGALPEEAFEPEFLVRFDPQLVFIPPAGRLLGLADLAGAIRSGYATNDAFRVQIRNVQVRREWPGYLLATYEEWQRNALESTPPDNGRVATVLFAVEDRLRWCHIHETWLPDDVMAAGPYDF